MATRLYSPEAFGVVSTIVSIASILAPIITLQYHLGIVTAKTDNEANIICALTFYIIVIMGLITMAGFIIYIQMNPSATKEVGYWIYISLPLLLLNGLGNVVESYNNRFGQYRLMSIVSLQRSAISNALMLFFGVLKMDYLGLVISRLISVVLGLRRQANYIITNYTQIFRSSMYEMRAVAVKYKVQPLFSLPGLFMTTYAFSILPLFINSLYSIKESGYFFVSTTMLGLPLSLISSSVAKIFFRNATLEKNNKGNFYASFKITLFLLTLVSGIGFVILWFVAEPFFSILYGNEWIKSGTFVKILIPMYAIRFIAQALIYGFIISGKQLLKLILQGFFIVEATAIYYFAKIYQFPIESFLEFINIAYFINYMVILIVLFYTSKSGGDTSETSKSVLLENQQYG
nr:oligosaccharide flippase family protein [Cohnella pontilimi]